MTNPATVSPTPVIVGVRPAGEDDLPTLADAHRLGHASVVDARGGALDILLRGRAEPIEDSFRNDLAAADVSITVGTANSLVVGYCVRERVSLRNGTSIMEISDLWVHPEARGIGVGSMLLQHALDDATTHGCTGIDARALPGDRATKNFFESFGLVARTIEVHRSL